MNAQLKLPVRAILIWAALMVSAGVCRAGTLPEATLSEFLASNGSGLKDAEGNREDWVEIWNTSGVSGDLGGWFLTDSPLNLRKWTFPAVELGAGQRLVVFASGKNRAILPGELHTSFKLTSAAGGYLALVKPDGVTVAGVFANYPAQKADISYGTGFPALGPVTLVADGAAAKWRVPTGPLSDWNMQSYNDSAWSAANMGIGFDTDGIYQAQFGAGGDLGTAMSANPTVYIRVPFTVANPTAIENLTLSMKWEDGFVAWLNGVEIQRQRATGTMAWNSTSDAGGRDEEAAVVYTDYAVTGDALAAGSNVLAIQGLNQSIGSSDLLIAAAMTGTAMDLAAPNPGFFPEPTPGAKNSARYDGLTADTKFTVDRGFHTAPFSLVITSATLGATIRYTTNGAAPTETSGTVYSGPIPVNKTTVVRALAYRSGYRSTNVDTHSYIFQADVITQPDMRTAITQDPVYGPQMLTALNAVPTISLSFAGTDIDRTEIPVSVELLNFEDGPKQANAGVVRYGSYVTDFAKRSIRLKFRSSYGASKLNYPLFKGHDYPIPPVESFDSLDIRAGNHDMVLRGGYLSNRFTDDSTMDMGHIAPHGRFVHIYFNGKYRGQYHLRERWNAAMLASYLPGAKEEYDTINANNTGREFQTGDLQDGDLVEWNQIQALLAGPQPYRAVKDMLDVPDLIDFVLLWTMGTCESEFRAGGSLSNGVGFKFNIKDADGFLQPANGTFLPAGGFYPATHNGPLSAMTKFRAEADPEFKILLADQIHKHFFNTGALTPAKNSARLQARIDEAKPGYVAEAARWGTHNGQTNRNPAQWLAYNDYFATTEFPALTDQRVELLKAAGMYPAIIAPVLSQFGGSLAPGAGITMTTDASAIYYTLDGGDPRLPGGAIKPGALAATFQVAPTSQNYLVSGDTWKYLDDGSDQGTAWRGAAFNDSAWAAGASELGYGDGDEVTLVGFVDTDPVTGGFQRNATTYFRRTVTVSSPSDFTRFLIGLKYDDGAAVYVNGVEVVRTPNLPANAAYNVFATSSTPSETGFEVFPVPTSRFIAGVNTIAVEIHNQSAGSSDISFDMTLRGEVDLSQGANRTAPVILTDAGPFNARARNVTTGEWSAVTSTFFSVNAVPASSENLTISEIHYHPAEPESAGELAVSADRDDYEFIELLNIGTQPVDLTGVYFSEGITFAFAANTILNRGGRVVIVSKETAFRARYGAVPIAGAYSGHLSNDGEQITVSLTGAGPVCGVLYNDVIDWPTLADGRGYSMVFVMPASGPAIGLPGSWAAHAVIGGGPGVADTTRPGYGNWKGLYGIMNDTADGDGDGLNTLLEYALGSSPVIAGTQALPVAGMTTVGADRYLTLTYGEGDPAPDLAYEIQISTDLTQWMAAPAVEKSPHTFRLLSPLGSSTSAQFLRLRVFFP